MMGDPKVLMPYQPFCDLHLKFAEQAAVQNYRRELDLNNATSVVTYKVGDVTYRREVFVSNPDQVLVIRLTADKPGKQSFTLDLDSPQPGTQVEATGANVLQLTGQIQPRNNPAFSWTGSWDKPGIKYAARLQVQAKGGEVQKDENRLSIKGADSVTILFSNATSFKNYKDISGDATAKANQYMAAAAPRSYEQLRSRHLADYQKLFSRVKLQLGTTTSQETTDERIRKFSKSDDPSLAALYFQFGRYLLISSSRPGGQPANLQGIWNQDLRPAWSSKYTTNINLEMNYWPAESGNLWETQTPLWDLIGDLRVTGAATAKTQYGAGGWVLHHNTDLWRATAPVDGSWGHWTTGGAWLANQMWDHYLFSQDREFLSKKAYPAMKETAQFFLDSLIEVPAGKKFAGMLVTSPSISPENQYRLNGQKLYLTYAATMDVELVSELFANCRKAAEILGVDKDFQAEVERTQKRLPPLQIGKKGQLQEWIEDYEETEPQHRHVSHLYSLYPGEGISLDKTPELAAAAKKTLELRGDGGTGWAIAWKISMWARLHEGDHAHRLLQTLISDSTLPNMFDVCPPFQIDGNFGGAAGIAEMLVQSRDGEIQLLPALPSAWSTGKVEGLRARGGAEVAIDWQQGQIKEASLKTSVAGKFRVRYQDKTAEVELRPGQTVRLDGNLKTLTSAKQPVKKAVKRG
jgi:alpha-L-fucosidase 2